MQKINPITTFFLILGSCVVLAMCGENKNNPADPDAVDTGIPVLIRPIHGERVMEPFFDWSDVANAKVYQLQAGQDSSFASPIIETTVNVSCYESSGTLMEGRICWRVRVQNSRLQWGTWSPIGCFYAVWPIADSSVVPSGTQATKLSTGKSFLFLEGPAWDGVDNLYFTDINNNRIHKTTSAGAFSVFRENSNASNGLMFDLNGRLLCCEGGAGRITALNDSGEVVEVIAAQYYGKQFNSPNDLVVDSKGGIYFTDPTWAYNPPQDKNGVYYRSPEGKLVRLIDDMDKPNGIQLSPDETILYVDDSNSVLVRAYDVLPEGSIANGRTFATLKTRLGSLTAVADGMGVDLQGRLYVTTELGVQIFRPDGQFITTITISEQPSNCTFGGAEMKTLFITARTNLYCIELNAVGIEFPLKENNKL